MENYKFLLEQLEDMKRKVNSIQREIDSSSNVVNYHVTNPKINLSVNNFNIKNLRPFGQENTDYITEKELMMMLRGKDCLPTTLLKIVHFNELHPENHNVFINNERAKYAIVYTGDKFENVPKSDVFRTIVENQENIIADRIDDVKCQSTRNKLEARREEIENMLLDGTKSDVRKRIQTKYEGVMYNNKDMIKRTKSMQMMPCNNITYLNTAPTGSSRSSISYTNRLIED